ncbi:hypothetical protein P9112_007808 [Eukaryota sp. TZLM1-RC]
MSRRSFNEANPPLRFFEPGEELPFGLGKANSHCLVDLEKHQITKENLSEEEQKDWKYKESQYAFSIAHGRISPEVGKHLSKHGMM